MGRYRHLSIEEREEIMCLRREGAGVGDIARAIRRDKSTVSRELRRNAYRDAGLRPRYRASTAQRRYEARRARCRRPRLLDDPGLRSLVQRKILEDHWSPEQVAGRVALEEGGRRVSASTIYRAINDRRLDTPRMRGTRRGMRGRLRHRGKRRHRRGEEERRGKIRVSHELRERPAEADRRERLGDWEGDTVVGRGAGPCLVTLVDRRSGYLAGGRASSHTKAAVADVEVAALSGVPALTVTPDRGAEFADWPRVTSETGAEFYFCAAHHPWEKGTVENANGLIREYFPKGTDFSAVTGGEVEEVYDALNRRPRKRLGWRTPWEVFHGEALHLL